MTTWATSGAMLVLGQQNPTITEGSMQSRAIRLTTLICVPAAAALIAGAPVTIIGNTHSVAACGQNQVPDNIVRSAGQAGDVYATCGPHIDATPWFSQSYPATSLSPTR